MSEHPAKRPASDLEHEEKRPKSAEPEDSSTSSSSRSPSPKRSHRSGVSHLLQTDAIPHRPTEAPPPIPTETEPVYEVRTVGVEREGEEPIPNYLFLSSDLPSHPVYNFLDSITEVSSN